MMHVTNTIQINGPLESSFDLVTTARFWPQWHPAALTVTATLEMIALGTVLLLKVRHRLGG